MIVGIPHALSPCGEYYVMDKTSSEYKKYKAGVDHQIEQWLLGNSIHNNWHDNEEFNECCPDFSCCGGQLWPENLRHKFVNSDQETRQQMLMMSLGSTLATATSRDIYISGQINNKSRLN